MADLDQAQSELDQFLDTQFTQTQPVENTTDDDEIDDEIVNEYLQGDDTTEDDTSTQEGYTPVQQKQPATTPSDNERILALERELAATRAREQMYQSALTAPQQPQVPQDYEQQPYTPFADDELQVSQEHVDLYHDADPYIASIARRVANDLYQRAVVPLQQELYNVQGALQAQQNFNVQQSSHTQYTQLKTMFPDFDQMINSAEWNSFLRQEDEYGTGARMVDYVQQGIRTNNIRQLASLVNKFKQQQSRGKPKPQQVAPGRAQTTLPNTVSTRAGKTLKMSDFERATAKFQAGGMTYDVYQRITDEFNAAMLEGRVNLNK